MAMDVDTSNDLLNEPLLAGTDADDELFHDVHSSASSVSSVSHRHPPFLSNASAAASRRQPSASTAVASATSYCGTASKLATGTLFLPNNAHGIVDTLPVSTESAPCLIFSDSDIYSAIAHICLLEKEVYSNNNNIKDDDKLLLPLHPKLFSVVHACKHLLRHEDAGMRMLKKLSKKNHCTNTSTATHATNTDTASSSSDVYNNLEIPVLLHKNNIFREISEEERNKNGVLGLLLPRFIDETIGAKNILSGGGGDIGDDRSVIRYNMNLFIQRHAALPNLFHSLLTSPSPTRRIELSTKLLVLLKLINSDLRVFQDGPYLCGSQYTLADIFIFPIIERIVVVLSIYRNFWIPPSLTNLIHWYEVMCDRDAIRVATADRSQESMDTYCYEKRGRNEYLLEVYECYALHEEKQFQQLNDELGRPGVNVYRREVCAEDEEQRRDRVAICERGKSSCQQCIIS
jgi:hypothetical protein